jgi:hypothetical protein
MKTDHMDYRGTGFVQMDGFRAYKTYQLIQQTIQKQEVHDA